MFQPDKKLKNGLINQITNLQQKYEELMRENAKLVRQRDELFRMVNSLAHIILQKKISENDRAQAEEYLEKVIPYL